VLLEEIPKFYDTERRLYVIDGHREELLIEAVMRTLERLIVMLQTFDIFSVVWRKEQKSMERFSEFLSLAEETVDKWQIWSPHPGAEEFVELQKKIAEMKMLKEGR
jgi:hypothetical protein